MRPVATFLACCLSGCVLAPRQLPITAHVSDAIVMATKSSKRPSVSYAFESRIGSEPIDTIDSITGQPNRVPFINTEAQTLDTMLRDYLALKFTRLADDADANVKVTLARFWVDRKNLVSAGEMIMAGVAGTGQYSVVFVANVVLEVSVTNNGKTTTKDITATGEQPHVFNGGYDQSEPYDYGVAKAIDSANNRALALLNQLLDASEI